VYCIDKKLPVKPIFCIDNVFIVNTIKVEIGNGHGHDKTRNRLEPTPGSETRLVAQNSRIAPEFYREPAAEAKAGLMVNVLPRERRIAVLQHLVEGNTLRSTARLTGVHRTTIMNHMIRFGEGCERLMDARFRDLTLEHVELDEVWTFVEKKQSRLTVDERPERHHIGDIYLWSAVDQETKLVPSFVVGKRSADNARRFLREPTHESRAQLRSL